MLEQYFPQDAIRYGERWALGRNPAYYDYGKLGGDCSNFISQCLFAGSRVMNHKKDLGWYYNTANDKAPAWTAVLPLHRFLTTNKGAGPYGVEISAEEIVPGDIIQIATIHPYYHHTVILLQKNHPYRYDDFLIAAHDQDALYRPLSSYDLKMVRFLHIVGVRR